jgi:O-methyltransferase
MMNVAAQRSPSTTSVPGLAQRVFAARRLVEPLVVYPLLHGGRVRGIWRHADLEWLARQVGNVPGDFAEIGVFRGKAFRKNAMLAHQQGKMAHAFDSFVGLDEPGQLDGSGFPKGMFGVGGVQSFTARMDSYRVPRAFYQLHPGYIPDCFNGAEQLRFSYVLLDVDHYEPTKEAIDWIWPRLSTSGVLALDDFLPSHEKLATLAIKEFLRAHNDFDIIGFFNQQLILRKIDV